MKIVKIVLITLSVLLNVVFIFFFTIALNTKNSSINFYNAPGNNIKTAASIVSVPSDGDISFPMVDITIRKGERASLQFSLFLDSRQSNYLINALYDHTLISVKENGFSLEITALDAGVTIMQTISDEGINNVAKITVTD